MKGTATYVGAVMMEILTFNFVKALPPPVLPPTFAINFTETVILEGSKAAENNGSWFYDFNLGSMRFDKLRGQLDVFCHTSGLNPDDKSASCTLLFANDLNLYVFYPEVKKCCKLCGKHNGCTVLKQTWLLNSTYTHDKILNGSTCHGWQLKGASTTDTWYSRKDGTPCQLSTTSFVADIVHTFTFNQSSFRYRPPPDLNLFTIPSYCNDKNCYPTFRGL